MSGPAKKKIFWVHRLTEDIKEALVFIRKYGNPLHAFLDYDEHGNVFLPAAISYKDHPEDRIIEGSYLVIKEDKNTYIYMQKDVENSLVICG